MNTVAFDTLKLAKKLSESGFTKKQASGAAEALAATLTSTLGEDVATKHDIKLLKHDIKLLKNDLEIQIKSLGHGHELLKRDLTIRLGGMLVAGIFAVAALVKIL